MGNGKVILYLAVSLDGYIARENGDVDWLPTFENDDFGYYEFYSTIDALIMGRKSYEQALAFGDFPYADKKCYVLSTKEQEKSKYVEFVDEDVEQLVHRLKKQGCSNIWLFGGAGLIDAFIKRNIIDDYIITTIPILLGRGIPLFSRDNPEIRLSLKGVRSFSQGVVELHYTR